MNPILGIALSLSLALAATGCATSSTKTLSKHDRAELLVEAATGAMIENDPIGALQLIKQAEDIEPLSAQAHHVRALAFLAKKDLPEALIHTRRAVAAQPDFSDAYNTQGKILMDLGRNSEAEVSLLKAAKDPLFREAYKAQTNLAILYYRKNDFARSKEWATKAIDASPQLACIAHYYRGHVELRENQLRDAVEDYEQSVKKYCGGFEDGHLALGIALERSGQYERARQKFLEIQQRVPTSRQAAKAMDHLRGLP